MALADQYARCLDRGADAVSRWVLGYRAWVLSLFGLLTIFFVYQAVQIDIEAGYEKAIPSSHPYMKVYREYAPQFGGANVVYIALVAQSGTLFTPEFFVRLEGLTRDAMRLPGVIPSFVRSLFTPDAVFVTYNEEGFAGGRIVPSDFVPSPEGIGVVQQNLLKSGEVGRLVSRDFSGALIRAEFAERDPQTDRKLDYRALGRELEGLRSKYAKNGFDVYIIGYPKFVNDVVDGIGAVSIFFLIALLITAWLLRVYLQSWILTFAALFVALDAVVWQLGLTHMLGLGVDPLSILVPFLIFSIGVSHAVQMTTAWKAAVLDGESPVQASSTAFRRVFVPGTTALLANAVGFAVIMVIDIPIIHELGIVASIGVAVMVLTNKFLLPILLSNVRQIYRRSGGMPLAVNRGLTNWLWVVLGSCAQPRFSKWLVVCSLAVLGYGVWARQNVVVGDAGVGAPELRADSRYNTDVLQIVNKFNINMDQIMVVAKSHDDGCSDFGVMYPIDRFHWMMANLPGVQSVESLAGEVRQRNVGNSEGTFKFYELPRSPFAYGDAMRYMEFNLKLFDQSCSAIPVRIYTNDHRSQTLASVIAAAKRFREENKGPGVDFLIAGGVGGVMAATNEAVKAAQNQMLLTLYASVAVLCLATFASWRMALCVLVPLILVSQFAEAVMYWLDIGLKVSTLPVVALGAGVGVDYGIYLLSRTQSAITQGMGLVEAYGKGLREAGTAVVFTAVTMTLGVVTWVFSPLKFQADMGLLLAYMFLVNMLGAVVLMPALAALLLPKRQHIDVHADVVDAISKSGITEGCGK